MLAPLQPREPPTTRPYALGAPGTPGLPWYSWERGGRGCWLPGAGLLGAGEPGATPPLVASVVFLGVVACRGHSCAPAHHRQKTRGSPENRGAGLGRPLGNCRVPGCLTKTRGGTAVLPLTGGDVLGPVGSRGDEGRGHGWAGRAVRVALSPGSARGVGARAWTRVQGRVA